MKSYLNFSIKIQTFSHFVSSEVGAFISQFCMEDVLQKEKRELKEAEGKKKRLQLNYDYEIMNAWSEHKTKKRLHI